MHANAPLTPTGRRILCERISAGRPIAHVAREIGVSRQTASKWWNRYLIDGESGLIDRRGPFPWDRLGLSAINGKGFALSTPMRILIPESEPRTVLVHELAHQWAGDAVTSETEGSGWLWEGLATYTETLFREHEGQNVFMTSNSLSSQVPDETRPLDQVDSIDDILDPVTYLRGALVYHALRLEIGDEAFFTTIREFIQRNLHGTAEVEDLQAVAEEISGDDLSQFFTSWVSETTVPQLPPTSG